MTNTGSARRVYPGTLALNSSDTARQQRGKQSEVNSSRTVAQASTFLTGPGFFTGRLRDDEAFEGIAMIACGIHEGPVNAHRCVGKRNAIEFIVLNGIFALGCGLLRIGTHLGRRTVDALHHRGCETCSGRVGILPGENNFPISRPETLLRP